MPYAALSQQSMNDRMQEEQKDEFLLLLRNRYDYLLEKTDSLTSLNVPENFKTEDAYYLNYFKDYYVRTEKHYKYMSTSYVNYPAYLIYGYYPVYYKVNFFTLQVLTEYSRDKFQYYSLPSNNFDELLDYRLLVLKPDGHKFFAKSSSVKTLSTDFSQYIKNYSLNQVRVPLVNLEVGDIICGYTIHREQVRIPQKTFYMTNDYPVVDFTSTIHVSKAIEWAYSANHFNVEPKKSRDGEFVTYSWKIDSLQGLNGQIYNDLNNLPVIRSVFRSVSNPFGGGYKLTPAKWDEVGNGLTEVIEEKSLSDTTGKALFKSNLFLLFNDTTTYSLKDSLDIIQRSIVQSNGTDKKADREKGKSFYFYFNEKVLPDSLVDNAYIEVFKELRIPLYYCVILPRHNGQIDRSIVFFSENFKTFWATRDNTFKWYYFFPSSESYKLEVNQLPFYYENSDFVAFRMKSKRYGLKGEPAFGTTTSSTPKSNIIQSVSDITVMPELDYWTVSSKFLFKGNSKYGFTPVESPDDFNTRPHILDSLEMLKSFFRNHGQLPDSMTMMKPTAENKLFANDIGFETKTKLFCSIFNFADNLYLIPVSTLAGYNPIPYLEIPRYYNFDLGYPYILRKTVNITFPWNIELQNIADYPLIINNKLGAVKMAIYQTSEYTVQIMIELTLARIYVLAFNSKDIKNFNLDMYNILSRSLIVKRK